MEIIKKHSMTPMEMLNYDKNKIPKSQKEIVTMGLGACEIRCLRVKVSPGSYLSKT